MTIMLPSSTRHIRTKFPLKTNQCLSQSGTRDGKEMVQGMLQRMAFEEKQPMQSKRASLKPWRIRV